MSVSTLMIVVVVELLEEASSPPLVNNNLSNCFNLLSTGDNPAGISKAVAIFTFFLKKTCFCKIEKKTLNFNDLSKKELQRSAGGSSPKKKNINISPTHTHTTVVVIYILREGRATNWGAFLAA